MKKFAGDIIILYMCTKNHDHMMYGSWDMKCHRQNFLSLCTIFQLFYPPNNPKNQNFEKMKETAGNIIILHKCTKNHDHMLYCSLDIACNECTYFSFWAIFCPFTLLTAWKINTFKKWKKHQCTINYDQMMYSSWDMVCGRYNCYFSFWVIFCSFTPLTAQKIKILKTCKKMKCLDTSSF